MKQLIIAEKPSVANDIAKALGADGHKFTKEGGGAQDAAFRDAELTLQQVQLPDGSVKINLAAVLDGDYYKQLIEKGSLSRLEKARRDSPMTTVATYETLISETKHIWTA